MADEQLNEASFIEHNSDYPIQAGGLTASLSQMLQAEEEWCKADPEKRADPERRLRFLASKIGAEALEPEHRYLLETSDVST